MTDTALCPQCPGATLYIDTTSQRCELCGFKTSDPFAQRLLDALASRDLPHPLIGLRLRKTGVFHDVSALYRDADFGVLGRVVFGLLADTDVEAALDLIVKEEW